MIIQDSALRRHKEQGFERKMQIFWDRFHNGKEERYIQGILRLCRTGK